MDTGGCSKSPARLNRRLMSRAILISSRRTGIRRSGFSRAKWENNSVKRHIDFAARNGTLTNIRLSNSEALMANGSRRDRDDDFDDEPRPRRRGRDESDDPEYSP